MPDEVSMRRAVPDPKWNSSAPTNEPIRSVPAVRSGTGRAVAVGLADGGIVDFADGATSAGAPADGSGSVSAVRMNSGEPRYHATGRPTTSRIAAAPID